MKVPTAVSAEDHSLLLRIFSAATMHGLWGGGKRSKRGEERRGKKEKEGGLFWSGSRLLAGSK